MLFHEGDEIIPYGHAGFHHAAAEQWTSDGVDVKQLAEGGSQSMGSCKEGAPGDIHCIRLSMFPPVR